MKQRTIFISVGLIITLICLSSKYNIDKLKVYDELAYFGSRKIPFTNIFPFGSSEHKSNTKELNQRNNSPGYLENQKRKIITKNFFYKNKVRDNIAISCYSIDKKFSKRNLDLPLNNLKNSLQAYRNDWQTFQLILATNEEGFKVKNCKILKSDFDIEVFMGEYVYCSPAPYSPKSKGWVLDPLVPISEALPMEIPKFENRCVFFNYYVPFDASIGKHSVEIEIQTKNDSLRYSIAIDVKEHLIPKTISLKTAFSFDLNWMHWYYKDSTLVWENAKYYYDFLLKQKISPTFIYKNGHQETWPPFKDWEYCINNGANFMFTDYYYGYNFFDNEDTLNMLKSISDKIVQVDSLNYKKYTGIYLFDELRRPLQYKIREGDSMLKNTNYPNLPLITTAPFTSKYETHIDVWCPKIDDYDFFKNNSSQDSSWLYICNTTTHPLPNFFLEYPLSDIDSLFAFMKRNPINGFLYWSLNSWRNNVDENNSKASYFNPETWNTDSYRGENGDGMLIYPWKNGKLIPSIRLLKIRDQLEIWDIE